MNRRSVQKCLSLSLLVLIAACNSSTVRVAVPPRVDTTRYGAIGIVNFSSHGDEDLGQMAAQNLMQVILQAQPGTRFLELGNESQVLESVRHGQMDAHSVALIRQRYKVDALITGVIKTSKVKPNVSVSVNKSLNATAVRVDAEVDATVTARLIETAGGATVWMASGTRRASVGNVTAGSGAYGTGGTVNVRNMQAQYTNLVQNVMREIAADFQPRWERREIRKDAT